MPDETVVDTTGVEESVAETPVPSTAPKPAVSTQPPSTAPKPSDAEARIRNLQSLLDQEKARVNTLTLEKSTLTNQVETIRREKENAIAAAAEATQQAMARAEERDRTNATLQAELTRASFIVKNPDLTPYAGLLPTTVDEAQLDGVAAQIRAAREADLEAVRTSVRTGVVVPPANPARQSGTLTAEEIQTKLREARLSGDSRRFEETLREFASRV